MINFGEYLIRHFSMYKFGWFVKTFEGGGFEPTNICILIFLISYMVFNIVHLIICYVNDPSEYYFRDHFFIYSLFSLGYISVNLFINILVLILGASIGGFYGLFIVLIIYMIISIIASVIQGEYDSITGIFGLMGFMKELCSHVCRRVDKYSVYNKLYNKYLSIKY